MICQKWQQEFCWYCLGNYSNYTHKGVIFCPTRITMKVIIWIYLLTFTVNLKFAIMFKGYERFLEILTYSVGVWALANIMWLSVWIAFIFLFLYEEVKFNNIMGYIYFFLIFLWPIGWIIGWIYAYFYWKLTLIMLRILLWQFVVFICIAAVGVVVFLINEWIKRRRERRIYNRWRAYPYQVDDLNSRDVLLHQNIDNSSVLEFNQNGQMEFFADLINENINVEEESKEIRVRI